MTIRGRVEKIERAAGFETVDDDELPMPFDEALAALRSTMTAEHRRTVDAGFVEMREWQTERDATRARGEPWPPPRTVPFLMVRFGDAIFRRDYGSLELPPDVAQVFVDEQAQGCPYPSMRRCLVCRYWVPVRHYTVYGKSPRPSWATNKVRLDYFTDCPLCGGDLDEPTWEGRMCCLDGERWWLRD
jgi:hypothetical protein